MPIDPQTGSYTNLDLSKNLASIPKLTSWSNEPSVEDLKADLSIAQTLTSSISSKVKGWTDELHIADKPKDSKQTRSQVNPPLIRKQAEWRYPALSEPFLSNPNLFEVTGNTWEDTKRAEQNAAVLNYQFRTKIGIVRFIDKYVRKNTNEGSVIVRVGWLAQHVMVKDYRPVFEYMPIADQESLETLQSYIEMQEQNPTEFLNQEEDVKESVRITMEKGMPIWASIVSYEEYSKKKLIKNQPTVDILNLGNVFIDPNCNGDLSKASFIVHSYPTCLSDLKKAGNRYKNLDRINVGQSSASQTIESGNLAYEGANNFKDDARKRLTAYEYWGYYDIDGSGITKPIVATWVDNVLIRLEDNPYPNGDLPFVLVQYLPKDNDLYGEPDAVLLSDDQKIIGAVTRGMIDLLGKSANGQVAFPKGALDSTNLRKYRNGEDYEYNPGFNPEHQIVQHKYPDIPQAAAFLINHCNNDAESLTGIKAFGSSGLTGSALGGSSATSPAVRGVLDAASKREMSILRRLADGLIQIGKKIIAMNAIFLEEEEVIRITNEKYMTIRRDDLAGDFDLSITISTPESDEAKANDLSFMLQTMGNNSDPELVKMLLSKIAKLRKMPDLAHQIETFQPTPDPLAQREREADIALKEAQAELYRAQAQQSLADSELRTAKIPEQEAKARKTEADAVGKEIDAERRYNGVDHAERMAEEVTRQDHAVEMAKFGHNANVLQTKAKQDVEKPE